mmetsp:Transcript_700/g.1606  ORF Transcript_700/g.1606 Transcript_700/m.1606 type:complete len:136 (-) Transcript_700:583-990(-)
MRHDLVTSCSGGQSGTGPRHVWGHGWGLVTLMPYITYMHLVHCAASCHVEKSMFKIEMQNRGMRLSAGAAQQAGTYTCSAMRLRAPGACKPTVVHRGLECSASVLHLSTCPCHHEACTAGYQDFAVPGRMFVPHQ